MHRERHGTQALYVAGVTADEYIPELAATPPAADPAHHRRQDVQAAGGAPRRASDTPFGEQRADRATGRWPATSGRLFVTAGGGLTGDGVILEVQGARRQPARRSSR